MTDTLRFSATNHAWDEPVDRRVLEDFIHREQALLDERDYRSWLNLLTDDCVYVIGSLDAQTRPQDEVVALVYDDRSRIEGRIARLESGFAHAENPPSRTRHFNSNLIVVSQEDGVVRTQSSLAVYRFRMSGMNVYVGRCEYTFRHDDGIKIARKEVHLDLYDLAAVGGVVSIVL